MAEGLTVAPAPHIGMAVSTRRIMLDVIIALVPAVLAAGYFFRFHALIVIGTCCVTAIATEYICNLIRKRPHPGQSLGDLSAIVTAIILAFSVPANLPVWAAVIGTAVALVIGKVVFGGLGYNIFNPAMVGRAFLTASFGMMMTTWVTPATIDSDMCVISASSQSVDIRTMATPLAQSKQAIKNGSGAEKVNNQLFVMFTGEVGGCLGETSVLALLIGGLYLLIKRTITIHIPLAVLLSVFVFASIGYFANPAAYINPLVHINAGAVVLCAFFIATDPVTSPLTIKGQWVFGAGLGALIMLIRMLGEYPGAVMYSVLLMNALTPLIDRLCKVTPSGGKPYAE